MAVQMVGWAFEPASEEILVNFISKGRADVEAWALKSGEKPPPPLDVSCSANFIGDLPKVAHNTRWVSIWWIGQVSGR